MSAAEPGPAEAAPAAAAGRPRRERGARESLGAIIGVFELFVLFLAGLVIWGLWHDVAGADGPPSWIALVGAAVVAVLLVAAIALLARPIGVWLGSAVQLLLLAGGFLNSVLFVVGGVFAAAWTYSMVVGTRLDRRNAAIRAAYADAETEAAAAAEPGAPDPAPSDDPRKDHA